MKRNKKRPKSAKTKSERSKLVRRAIKLQSEIEALRAKYDELDAITMALKSAGFIQMLTPTHAVTLVDNFAHGENVVFRTTSVRRFELKIVKERK